LSDIRDSIGEIRNFWTKAAQNEHDHRGLRPTAPDAQLQRAIEAAVEMFVYPGAKLLDIGCGDGLSALQFAQRAKMVLGIDYIPAFVSRARQNASTRHVSNAVFEQGDVMDLGAIRTTYGSFDIVSVIRCLINLGNWENQAKAITQIALCMQAGGVCITAEGWQDGFDGLNLRRQRAGLEPIAVAEFNTPIRRSKFEAEVSKYFDVIDYYNLGFYIFMSRVVQPLLVAPDQPRHDHPLNVIAGDLQMKGIVGDEFLDCDYAGIYVLRRKA
jgi:ubiquinone/menaquinone biosynthesis C-methylase UbiE